MNGWKLGWEAAKAYGRASRSVSESVQATYERNAAERVPRRVRNRGYLAPGDPAPPPGLDVLDYSGLAPARAVRGALYPDGVTLGAAIDLADGAPFAVYRLPLERFFQHVAVVAPPGKGKTYGMIAPLAARLARAGATVVVLDVTGDLVNAIKDFAGSSPTGTAVPFFHWSTDAARGRHAWNPLAGLDPDDLTAVEGLKTSILGEQPADPKHRFFFDRELRILGALIRLLLAEAASPTLTDLIALAVHRDVLRKRLARPEHAGLRLEIRDFLAADDADAAQMVSETQTRLAPFVAPQVSGQVSRSDFTIADIARRPSLVVVGAELYLRQRGEIAASLFVNRLSAELSTRYGTTRGAPVVMLLDEAPVLARRINLASLLATSRATRTGVVIAAQNVAQFGDEGEQSTVFDACDTMMLLPGASRASIGIFQSRLGTRQVRRQSTSREFGKGHGSVSVSGETVDVLGNRELLDPPFGQFPAFVHSRSDGVGPVAIELERLTVNSWDR
ncbi:MAG TPA: type IV secretory system conjugative DNA transfer family protein [Trebonia sp.]|nr:type IV secretory system conjugative DNA transfer family protein [Trebonia sp.]